MKRIFFQIFIIFILSICCGIVFSLIHSGELLILKSYRPDFKSGTLRNGDPAFVDEIDADTLHVLLQTGGIILLDARDPDEFRKQHIPSAWNFPVRYFESRYREWILRLDSEKMIVTYCSEETCLDSLVLAEKLIQKGFDQVAVFQGGMKKWSKMGFQIEGEDTGSQESDE